MIPYINQNLGSAFISSFGAGIEYNRKLQLQQRELRHTALMSVMMQENQNLNRLQSTVLEGAIRQRMAQDDIRFRAGEGQRDRESREAIAADELELARDRLEAEIANQERDDERADTTANRNWWLQQEQLRMAKDAVTWNRKQDLIRSLTQARNQSIAAGQAGALDGSNPHVGADGTVTIPDSEVPNKAMGHSGAISAWGERLPVEMNPTIAAMAWADIATDRSHLTNMGMDDAHKATIGWIKRPNIANNDVVDPEQSFVLAQHISKKSKAGATTFWYTTQEELDNSSSYILNNIDFVQLGGGRVLGKLTEGQADGLKAATNRKNILTLPNGSEVITEHKRDFLMHAVKGQGIYVNYLNNTGSGILARNGGTDQAIDSAMMFWDEAEKALNFATKITHMWAKKEKDLGSSWNFNDIMEVLDGEAMVEPWLVGSTSSTIAFKYLKDVADQSKAIRSVMKNVRSNIDKVAVYDFVRNSGIGHMNLNYQNVQNTEPGQLQVPISIAQKPVANFTFEDRLAMAYGASATGAIGGSYPVFRQGDQTAIYMGTGNQVIDMMHQNMIMDVFGDEDQEPWTFERTEFELPQVEVADRPLSETENLQRLLLSDEAQKRGISVTDFNIGSLGEFQDAASTFSNIVNAEAVAAAKVDTTGYSWSRDRTAYDRITDAVENIGPSFLNQLGYNSGVNVNMGPEEYADWAQMHARTFSKTAEADLMTKDAAAGVYNWYKDTAEPALVAASQGVKMPWMSDQDYEIYRRIEEHPAMKEAETWGNDFRQYYVADSLRQEIQREILERQLRFKQ